MSARNIGSVAPSSVARKRGRAKGVDSKNKVDGAGAAPEMCSAGPAQADMIVLCHALAERQHQLDQALAQIHALEQSACELKAQIELERRFANHDELTGLPNRRLLRDRFEQAALRASRRQGKMAVLFIDLDGFKLMNDGFGHDVGDDVLRLVAARLTAGVRNSDTVCRYGGDEFVVLLMEVGVQQSALAAAAKVRALLAKPYPLDEQVVRMSASVGLAVYPDDGGCFSDLIARADMNMYADKTRRPKRPVVALHSIG